MAVAVLTVVLLTASHDGGAVFQPFQAPPRAHISICEDGPARTLPAASCDVLTRSTKYAPECGDGSGSGPTFPLLVTGVGGNLQDAAFEWFRGRGIRLARDNAPPNEGFGAMSWVLAFNDWDNYPKSAKLEASKVAPRIEVCSHAARGRVWCCGAAVLFVSRWRVVVCLGRTRRSSECLCKCATLLLRLQSAPCRSCPSSWSCTATRPCRAPRSQTCGCVARSCTTSCGTSTSCPSQTQRTALRTSTQQSCAG
jgi:hypothetical protein